MITDINLLPAIVGPTGIGKTAFALEVAKELDGELLSVDSRQIYAGMDIATGKEVDQGEWVVSGGRKVLKIEGVSVHGLDLVKPTESFSVSEWLGIAAEILQDIQMRGKLPILVGGTGYYLDALQGKIETLHIAPNAALRKDLEGLSLEELQQRLRQHDASRHKQVDVLNKRRLIRAIEIATTQDQGRRAQKPRQKDMVWQVMMIGLTMERQKLYTKVDARIEAMVTQGLVEETQRLLLQCGAEVPSMSGIGYAEMVLHLRGELSLAEAVQRMKWRTHAYIRRQLTWFRKQSVSWYDIAETGWEQLALEELRRRLEVEQSI